MEEQKTEETKKADTNQASENTHPSSQDGQTDQSTSQTPPTQEETGTDAASENTPDTTPDKTPSSSGDLSDANAASPASSESALPVSQPATTPPPSSAPRQKKMYIFPTVIVLILLFVGFLVGAAWYFQAQLQKSTSQTAVSVTPPTSMLPKHIVVGTDPTFQPMEYMDKGKMLGYDIDLTNLLAKELNVKVTFKNITFDNLFTALQQHQIDMIISAVTITPERQKQYAFSEPYLNAGQVIITQKTNTTIKSPKQLMGKKIGVQQGTTDEQEAMKYTTSNLVIKYPDFEKATSALVAGTVDAIITDLPSAQGIVSSNPSLKIASDPFTNDYYGIVLRKGDPNVEAVNKALVQLRLRGYLTELKYKWLD